MKGAIWNKCKKFKKYVKILKLGSLLQCGLSAILKKVFFYYKLKMQSTRTDTLKQGTCLGFWCY